MTDLIIISTSEAHSPIAFFVFAVSFTASSLVSK